MNTERFVVASATVETDGGRPLRVSRYTDPATGRDLVTLAHVWLDDVLCFPATGRDVLTLPADSVTNLAGALQALAEESD